VSPDVRAAAQQLRAALAALRAKEDLISIGAYQQGTDPLVDAALAHRREIDAFLRQDVAESSSPDEGDHALLALAASIGAHAGTQLGDGGRAFAAPLDVDGGEPAIPRLELVR
jgi:flagellum-specific ATP synthase